MKNLSVSVSLLLLLGGSLSACSLFGGLHQFAPTETPTTPTTPILIAPSSEPGIISEPTAAPTFRPTAEPSAEPTPLPAVQSSAVSLPSDLSVISSTTLHGQIHDDNQLPLGGATVTARSLNSSIPFESVVSTDVGTLNSPDAGGKYRFSDAPTGVQIEIIAFAPGYSTRRRVEVLKSNQQGDPNANRYDFGPGTLNGNLNNALSLRPEVVAVSPGRNARGVAPDTPIVLRFSKPMNTAWIEAQFRLTSVHTTYDVQDFQVRWNADATEIVLQGRTLEPATSYTISFTTALMAQDGATRFDAFFKLTDGPFEPVSRFETR